MRISISILALLLLLSPAIAGAARSKAETMIEQGVKLREEGKDAEALEVFKAAFAESNDARARAQIALAEQALGRWLEAERDLGLALAEKKHPWIRQNTRALGSALAVIREHLGDLEVLSQVRGAEIAVDGRAAGTLPLAAPIRVVAGTVVIDVRAEGYWPLSRKVVVPAGGLAREAVELVERKVEPPAASASQQQPPPVATPPVAPPVQDQPLAPQSPAVVEVKSEHPSGGGPSPLVWAGGTAAILATIAGVVAIVIRNGHANEYNDDTRCLINGLSREENCAADRSAAQSAQTIATAAFIGAGALAAGTAALYWFGSSSEPDRTALVIGPGPGVVGLSIGIY